MIDLDFLNAEHARALDLTAAANQATRSRKERRGVSSRYGSFHLLGNKMQADWLRDYPNLTVDACFDPRNFDAGADVFTVTGRFLGRVYPAPDSRRRAGRAV